MFAHGQYKGYSIPEMLDFEEKHEISEEATSWSLFDTGKQPEIQQILKTSPLVDATGGKKLPFVDLSAIETSSLGGSVQSVRIPPGFEQASENTEKSRQANCLQNLNFLLSDLQKEPTFAGNPDSLTDQASNSENIDGVSGLNPAITLLQGNKNPYEKHFGQLPDTHGPKSLSLTMTPDKEEHSNRLTTVQPLTTIDAAQPSLAELALLHEATAQVAPQGLITGKTFMASSQKRKDMSLAELAGLHKQVLTISLLSSKSKDIPGSETQSMSFAELTGSDLSESFGKPELHESSFKLADLASQDSYKAYSDDISNHTSRGNQRSRLTELPWLQQSVKSLLPPDGRSGVPSVSEELYDSALSSTSNKHSSQHTTKFSLPSGMLPATCSFTTQPTAKMTLSSLVSSPCSSPVSDRTAHFTLSSLASPPQPSDPLTDSLPSHYSTTDDADFEDDASYESISDNSDYLDAVLSSHHLLQDQEMDLSLSPTKKMQWQLSDLHVSLTEVTLNKIPSGFAHVLSCNEANPSSVNIFQYYDFYKKDILSTKIPPNLYSVLQALYEATEKQSAAMVTPIGREEEQLLCSSGWQNFPEESDVMSHKARKVIPFDFSTPSPDDIVKSKQKTAFGGKYGPSMLIMF